MIVSSPVTKPDRLGTRRLLREEPRTGLEPNTGSPLSVWDHNAVGSDPARTAKIPLSHRPQQHRVPVKVEKAPLPLGKFADVDDVLRLREHRWEAWLNIKW
jgi:hypothetical protein